MVAYNSMIKEYVIFSVVKKDIETTNDAIVLYNLHCFTSIKQPRYHGPSCRWIAYTISRFDDTLSV